MKNFKLIYASGQAPPSDAIVPSAVFKELQCSSCPYLGAAHELEGALKHEPHGNRLDPLPQPLDLINDDMDKLSPPG